MSTITYSWTATTTGAFVNDVYTAGSQNDPSVGVLAGGRYFVAWNTPGNTAVEGRLFNANGSAVASEFLVNTSALSNQFNSSVAGLNNGNVVVVYTSQVNDAGDIRAQLISPTGAIVPATDIGLVTVANIDREASVAALSNGNFVVSWTRDFGGGDHDVSSQVFSSAGAAISGNIATSSTSLVINSEHASVAALAGGGFVTV